MLLCGSCRSSGSLGYCVNSDNFAINITANEISDVDKKLILDRIVNGTSIRVNKDSDMLIELKITLRRNVILMSPNNTVDMENLNFIVYYEVMDRVNKVAIDRGRFIISDDLNVSENRFANYTANRYVMENFAKNLSIRLENKIVSLLANKKCKKVQNDVANYYFNINIAPGSKKDSHHV